MATVTHATIELLLETRSSTLSMQRGYKEDSWRKLFSVTCLLRDAYTEKRPSILKPIFSSERILHKDYDCKVQLKEKSLVMSLKGLGTKVN
jgi:hypothetical protein